MDRGNTSKDKETIQVGCKGVGGPYEPNGCQGGKG